MTPAHDAALSCKKHVSPSLVILPSETGRSYSGFTLIVFWDYATLNIFTDPGPVVKLRLSVRQCVSTEYNLSIKSAALSSGHKNSHAALNLSVL